LREQVLVLIVSIVLVGGAYGGLRFYPENKAIAEINKNTLMMDEAMKTSKVAEEPYEDAESLEKDLAEIELELKDAQSMMQQVEKKLSPLDTTEVRLAISEVARNAMVRISANEEYRVSVPVPVDVASDKKQAKDQPTKRLGDAAQRRLRNERKATRNASAAMNINQVNVDQATLLVRKMAVNAPMERPMQRIVMEGTYAGMMRFISGLAQMNFMVTIVQFQLMPTAQTPPPGHNQRITMTLVLAL
jgi:hypothetical protein